MVKYRPLVCLHLARYIYFFNFIPGKQKLRYSVQLSTCKGVIQRAHNKLNRSDRVEVTASHHSRAGKQ